MRYALARAVVLGVFAITGLCTVEAKAPVVTLPAQYARVARDLASQTSVPVFVLRDDRSEGGALRADVRFVSEEHYAISFRVPGCRECERVTIYGDESPNRLPFPAGIGRALPNLGPGVVGYPSWVKHEDWCRLVDCGGRSVWWDYGRYRFRIESWWGTADVEHIMELAQRLVRVPQGNAHRGAPTTFEGQHPGLVERLAHDAPVPLFLPRATTDLRYAEGETTSDRDFAYYAYNVTLTGTIGCIADACSFGGIEGHAKTSDDRRLSGEPVALPNIGTGVMGYFTKFRCAATCGDSMVTWDVGRFRYVVGFKVGKEQDVVRLARDMTRYPQRLSVFPRPHPRPSVRPGVAAYPAAPCSVVIVRVTEGKGVTYSRNGSPKPAEVRCSNINSTIGPR